MTGEYAKLSTQEVDDQLGVVEDLDQSSHGSRFFSPPPPKPISDPSGVIGNDFPAAIHRAPTKPRDWIYGVAFFVHFIAILLLSMAEKVSLRHSLIHFNRAGSWASIIMIATLLGSFLGAICVMYLLNTGDKGVLLYHSLSFAFVLKVCIGNIMLIMRSHYSFLGVFILCSALWDWIRFKPAKASLSFTVTVMDMVSKVFQVYGLGLSVCCALIVATQTLVLLWWGAFFTGLISTISPHAALFASFAMALSLYWITQFFHMVLAYVIGGCTLWLFVQDKSQQSASSSNEESVLQRPASSEQRSVLQKKLLLYSLCAATTSFGSLCKAALFIPLANSMAQLRHTALQRSATQQSTWCFGYSGTGCMMYVLDSLCVTCKLRLHKYHKLILPLLAVYSRTLSRTADDQINHYPETITTSLEEYTDYTMQSLSTSVAGLVAICFALIAESKEGQTWPLFFLVCYFVFASGFSLALHVFPSAVDAFIVAAAINPSTFGHENQLVLLRFYRTAELEAR